MRVLQQKAVRAGAQGVQDVVVGVEGRQDDYRRAAGCRAWAFVNAALFTAYVMLAHRLAGTGDDHSPIDRLGASMLVASAVITPLGLASALPALTNPVTLAAGIGIGISSSVIPYAFDQLAMRRLPRETYSPFVALLPTTVVIVNTLARGAVTLRGRGAPRT